jgi:putative flippase GtrA
MLQHRLARFGIVGIAATLVHATTLILLKTLFQLGTGPANLLGFLVSFTVSMYGQQRFTFKDRLQGKTLNGFGICILFLINALAALGLGSATKGNWLILLPLVPALINYVLLYIFSGSRHFRS